MPPLPAKRDPETSDHSSRVGIHGDFFQFSATEFCHQGHPALTSQQSQRPRGTCDHKAGEWQTQSYNSGFLTSNKVGLMHTMLFFPTDLLLSLLKETEVF